LRKWFSHDPQKWAEFRQRCRDELKAKPQLVLQLLQMAAGAPVTLVYAAQDTRHNRVLLLLEQINPKIAPGGVLAAEDGGESSYEACSPKDFHELRRGFNRNRPREPLIRREESAFNSRNAVKLGR
jgi:hypothetical protein